MKQLRHHGSPLGGHSFASPSRINRDERVSPFLLYSDLECHLPWNKRSTSGSPVSSPVSWSDSSDKHNGSFRRRRSTSRREIETNHHPDHHHYSHHSTTHQTSVMVNRSGKAAVKEHLSKINAVCQEQEERSKRGDAAVSPPIELCAALSYWSSDAYYAIVISKNGGIATIIRAMTAFLDVSDCDVEDYCPFLHAQCKHKVHSNASRFQAYCTRILLSLSQASDCLQQLIIQAGGRDLVLAAIQKYPRSFDVSTMGDFLKANEHSEDASASKKKEHNKPLDVKQPSMNGNTQLVQTNNGAAIATDAIVAYF